MNIFIKTSLLGFAALSVSTFAASAQSYDRQTDTSIPSGSIGDILNSPRPVGGGVIGNTVGAAVGIATLPLVPFEGRSAYVGPSYGSGYDRR